MVHGFFESKAKTNDSSIELRQSHFTPLAAAHKHNPRSFHFIRNILVSSCVRFFHGQRQMVFH